MKIMIKIFFMILISTLSLTGCISFNLDDYDFTFEGYVVDLVTGEGIGEARIQLNNDKILKTNDNGKFQFTHSINCVTCGYCSAEGYGILRGSYNLELYSSKENKIYLIKPYGIYGRIDYSNSDELEISLEGNTFEGEEYKKVTTFDEKGYFHFSDVPFHSILDLCIYKKGEEDNCIYHCSTDPVLISKDGAQFLDFY